MDPKNSKHGLRVKVAETILGPHGAPRIIFDLNDESLRDSYSAFQPNAPVGGFQPGQEYWLTPTGVQEGMTSNR